MEHALLMGVVTAPSWYICSENVPDRPPLKHLFPYCWSYLERSRSYGLDEGNMALGDGFKVSEPLFIPSSLSASCL